MWYDRVGEPHEWIALHPDEAVQREGAVHEWQRAERDDASKNILSGVSSVIFTSYPCLYTFMI